MEHEMFYKVQIRDAEGKLKKILTSSMLSTRHWKMFPDNIKKDERERKLKTKNKVNNFSKKGYGTMGI
jgi:hypothetical protein